MAEIQQFVPSLLPCPLSLFIALFQSRAKPVTWAEITHQAVAWRMRQLYLKKKQTKKGSSAEDQFKVYGHELVEKIKELIKEGNIRRIIIKNEKDKVMMEIPVTFAVVGAFFAPVLAAVGALAALMTKCRIEVERK